jgi:hypothetical protein
MFGQLFRYNTYYTRKGIDILKYDSILVQFWLYVFISPVSNITIERCIMKICYSLFFVFLFSKNNDELTE